MRTVCGFLSPNAQTSTGRENYYATLTEDQIAAVGDQIAADYEGRRTARSQSPFRTQHWEDEYKSVVSPIAVDVHSDDWFDHLQNAVHQLHIHLEIESGEL